MARSGTGVRRPPARGRLRPWRLLLAATAAMSIILLVAALNDGGRLARIGLPWSIEVDDLTRRAGVGIDQVTVAGHHYASDEDIFGALDLANVRSMLRFDSRAARQRIERIPWVATAEITRVFPGGLDIRVVERKPFALWRRGPVETLIDASGRELQQVDPGAIDHLPRVVGEGAAEEAGTLIAMVARHPALATRFQSAERVGERRWTLRLTGGIEIHLPAEGPALALELLERSGRLEQLLSNENMIIDLRGRGRVAVRPAIGGSHAVARVSAAGHKE